jgi:hypothetical protein
LRLALPKAAPEDGVADMHGADVAILAGLLAALAGAALTVRQAGRRLREPARERAARKVEEIADIASQAVLFGGIALVMFGNAAQHMSGNTPPAVPWLSLTSSTAIVLIFGFHLGRLVMRWQVRNLVDEPGVEKGEAAARS